MNGYVAVVHDDGEVREPRSHVEDGGAERVLVGAQDARSVAVWRDATTPSTCKPGHSCSGTAAWWRTSALRAGGRGHEDVLY